MRRRIRPLAVAGACLLAAAVGPGVVSAHDVTGSRFTAPLPLELLLAGAGGTVALTALWLAVTDRAPAVTGRGPTVSLSVRTAGLLRILAGGLFLAGVVTALVAGVAGRQVAADNVATVFVWPVWFRGVALLAVLVGNLWPALSPWRAAYRGLCRLEGDRLAVLGEYPARLGDWPALAGFLLLIGVVENLTVVPRSPALTTVVVAVYALAMVGGAVLFGEEWFRRADPLGLLYRLFGRVAPVEAERSAGGDLTLSLRPPWRGCRAPVAGTAVVAFVVAAVYAVSFDGFTNTRLYQDLLFGTREALGTGPPTSILLYVVGLALFVGVFLATARLGDALGDHPPSGERVAADGGVAGWRGAAREFAPTVLPIAAAYDVAHNYPYVVRSTARLAELLAADLGLALGALDPLAWLGLPAYWGSQALLIVLGHVFAVVAAHRVAMDRYRSPSSARRGHLPLVVLMVGYTVLSLWIVSRPVVT
jgi:hypothetical protein